MNKEFYYYEAKYEIDEYGNLARSEYEDDRPHNYGGKIIVLHRHNKRKTIKPFIDKDGYAQVILKSHNHSKHYKIHQLMYLVYIRGIVHIDDMGCGYDFKNKNFIQINHIDGNKLNNYYSNLEIVTLQENILHSIKHKLHNSQRNAKYVEIYKDNVLLGVIWKTREASAWLYNNYGITIHHSTISRCAKYNLETKGFRFKYKV